MTGTTVVVDYGIGNVFSVCNALKQVGEEPVLTGDLDTIRKADRVILPGVGAFARAMEALRARGLAGVLREFVATGKPFLGICIGMQVLMNRSTEFGEHEGLGFVPGQVERIPDTAPDGRHLRVPHIGWAILHESGDRGASWVAEPLASTQRQGEAVYFVHSYHCVPTDASDRIAYADYDGTEITAAVRRDNIVGVQFHPERSGVVGQKILAAFVAT